jgi:prolyl-tRNA synthetase
MEIPTEPASRLTKLLVPTLKEAPAEAEVASHILMLRGGYLRKMGPGIFSLLPLGWRVMRKIERIVRQEMDRAGAQEVSLPAVLPAELWQQSGRSDGQAGERLRLEDRRGGGLLLGPGHEEAFVGLVRGDVRSYRQLPVCLYRVQAGWRDELRPWGGLLRSRDRLEMQACSFDASPEDAERTYRLTYQTYRRIFGRCGLVVRSVEAGGGARSHAFQALVEAADESLLACDGCSYAASADQARSRVEVWPEAGPEVPALARVVTPGKRTIEEVTAFLGVPAAALAKTLIYLSDGEPIAVLVRGDRKLNETKLRSALGARELVMATDRAVEEVTGAPVGFAGPVGLRVPIHCDEEVAALPQLVCGANAADLHHRHVVVGRDFRPTARGDYRYAAAGDRCSRCEGGRLGGLRGVEVGHLSSVGTAYSGPMKGTFLDSEGKERDLVMGSYTLGLGRIAAAAIEQSHDADGIIWPVPIAPFEVTLLALQANDPDVLQVCEGLEGALAAAGLEVLHDDRDERPGVKFKDADLVGIPYRIAVGKKGVAESVVEIKSRRSPEVLRIKTDEAVAYLRERILPERLGAGAEVTA